MYTGGGMYTGLITTGGGIYIGGGI
jgi:hypothetical protein